jgi:hypothetical protein
VNTIVHPPRRGEFDLLRYISIDPDEFFAAEKRRKQILEMEDRIRPGRTTPVAIRLGLFTIERLKTLAALHNTGYQTLLKEFVVERILRGGAAGGDHLRAAPAVEAEADVGTDGRADVRAGPFQPTGSARIKVLTTAS